MYLRVLSVVLVASSLVACDRPRAIETRTSDNLCKSSRRDTPCRISSYQLISNPTHYEGSFVELMLYFGSENFAIGFINRDAQMSGDSSASFIVGKSSNEAVTRGGYWRVWGKFHADRTDRVPGLETYRQAGAIDQVVRLNSIFPEQH